MAIWHSISGRRSFKQRKRRKTSPARPPHQAKRNLGLEPFEERILLAIDGPQLLAAIPATGVVINDGTILTQAPREILLRFSRAIDTSTISNSSIQFVRSVDDTFGNGNDITITPGYIGVDNPNLPNEVLVRFSENLPDDNYRMIIVGAGANALKDSSGKSFQDGANMSRPFSLDLASQVVAVVPQPVSRDANGKLTQDHTKIEVYFNSNDPLDQASVTNVNNYQLIRTGGANGTATTEDDQVFYPTSVSYSAASGKAILTFQAAHITTAGTYRLRIGTNESQPPVIQNLAPPAAGDIFASASSLGSPFANASGTKTVALRDTINVVSTSVVWPGDPREPGDRGGLDPHITGNPADMPVWDYYFPLEYGNLGGQPLLNTITETQKERFREILEYYSFYLGVQFRETVSSGTQLVVGDPRVIGYPISIGGVANAGRVLMNTFQDWGASERMGAFFRTAMHEVGHMLGLGHNYESPSTQGTGVLDDVLPGDFNLIYGNNVLPKLGNDVNIYSFNLSAAGKLNIETIAERMQTLNVDTIASRLDSVISVYDATGNLIARNDDYYGKDSFLQLDLAAGAYYVAISSTGNTSFDPRVTKSGSGGRTMGDFQLRMTFTPSVSVANSIRDTTGRQLDGDNDGLPGGVNNFWFKVSANTIYVDKVATGGTGALGSITNPYTRINDALAAAPQGSVVRIVGNGGADNNPNTLNDNVSYNVGFDSIGGALSDGTRFEVPRGVTVMVDAGAIIKLRGANVNVGSVDPSSINRAQGALQVLGTPTNSVYFTSYYDTTVGAPVSNIQAVSKGNWGGIVFRDDSDLEANGVFLNYVNNANIRWGGGSVTVNGEASVYRPIHMESARPTITFNRVISSADAAMSATPNSFEESQFQGTTYYADYTRVGPKVYGNTLLDNSINGLYIAIETSSQTGRVLDELTVTGRIANTDIIHVLTETLVINGQPGGFIQGNGDRRARPDASLIIDAGSVIKLSGGRFETEIGGTFIAEGTLDRPIVFTSLYDDRYGRGGSSDTSNNGLSVGPMPADWGGFLFGPTSTASIDTALVAFAGGTVRFEGFLSGMDPVEIHQAKVRIANSSFRYNAMQGGDYRNGRGAADPALIYVRGAQPVILNNVLENNVGLGNLILGETGVNVSGKPVTGAVISINVNALNSDMVDDWGRSRGAISPAGSYPKNLGPLIRNNLVGNNTINGMLVRGGLITTNSVWDDTDIVHVVNSTISTGNQQSLTGTLRLQSSPTESLVVKVLGTNVDFVAGGEALDFADRTGGSLQIVGTPGHNVVITSLKDDSVGAGLTPQGAPQRDTLNRKGIVPPPPANTNSGPVILDTTARDVRGGPFAGLDGWDTLVDELRYVYNNSQVANKPTRILVIGWESPPTEYSDLGTPYSAHAIRWAAGELGLQVTFADNNVEVASGVANAENYALIFISSHGNAPWELGTGDGYPLPTGRAEEHENVKWWGGASDDLLAQLNATQTKAALLDYINNKGGGLLAMALDSSEVQYNFLVQDDTHAGTLGTAWPEKFTLRESGGNVLAPTAAAIDGFLEAELTELDLNIGTPFRTAFEGPSGFNRLTPWAVDPVTGEVAILGHAAGGPGIGGAYDIVRPGDWGSVRLDVLSNDTNIEVINEVEQAFTSTGDTNQTPNTAQPLGELAKDMLSGNDNVRLGFEVYGNISQTVNSPGGGDVDVYGFRGTAGTLVWFDIDRTSSALRTLVELVDANGAVIAANWVEDVGGVPTKRYTGSAMPLQSGTETASPFSHPDFFSTNEYDGGMRVVLPGTPGNVNNYYVRVRSTSATQNTLTAGLSKGNYMLQMRLQETDQFAGSTIRYADVRYAENGIEVIGKPEQSPLVTNTVQSSIGNNFFLSAQDLGNLLESKNGTIEVKGEFPAPQNGVTPPPVHWYKFNMNYAQFQQIGGHSDGLKTFAAMLQVNFADGLGRPDTTISLYDQFGTLLMIARDGEIADSLPRPNEGGIGADAANLKHGSFGVLDPTLGPVQLPTGGLTNGNENLELTYYVAISTDSYLPEVLTASFGSASSNPLIRLEPIDSIRRVVDDRVGSNGGKSTTSVDAGRLFGDDLNSHADPYHFGDVVMFVNIEIGNQSALAAVNPFTGEVMTLVELGTTGGGFYNIAMRNDGQLVALSHGGGEDNSGNYVRFNSATGDATLLGDDGVRAFVISGERPAIGPWPTQASDYGLQYTAFTFLQSPDSTSRRLFAVARRHVEDSSPNNGFAATVSRYNILVELDPNTGAVLNRVAGNGVYNNESNTTRSLTNFVPKGILSGAGNTLDDQMAGMAIIKATDGNGNVTDTMFTITPNGRLYRLTDDWKAQPSAHEDIDSTGIEGGAMQIPVKAGRRITGLSAGPLRVENGAYSQLLFAIDDEGGMYAFDANGVSRGVFFDGNSTIDISANSLAPGLSVEGIEGMAFSTFDFNLWHATEQRAFDPGHGINQIYNNNPTRDPSLDTIGGKSYYFGLSPVPSQGSTVAAQPGARAYSTNPALLNSYAVPGGTYGTLTSGTFSLEGYSPYDRPTLYFNYLLDTPDFNTNAAQLTNDSFRVYASTDGANWELLATNNIALGSDDAEHGRTITASGGLYDGTGAKQRVQGLYDSTLLPGSTNVAWQQARIDLGDFAGRANIQLRFEFSTAGTLGLVEKNEVAMTGQGRVLKALPGSQIPANTTITIGGVEFKFVTASPGAANEIVISGNDTSREVAEKIAAALDRRFSVNDIPGIYTSVKLVGDELRLFGRSAVTNPGDPTRVGPFAYFEGYDSEANERDRGSLNLITRDRSETYFEGIYIDDFVIGFASRGEVVANALPGAIGFADVPRADDAPAAVTRGAYQLQIRPATSYGSSNEKTGEFKQERTFDVNDRFAQGITLIVAPAATPPGVPEDVIGDGDGYRIDDGSQVLTFELDSNGVWNSTDPKTIRVQIFEGEAAASVAQKLASAINAAVTANGFKVRARASNNGNRVDLFDAVSVQEISLARSLVFDRVGDIRPQQGATAPGQTIIQNSMVSHSRQVGIQVIPKINQIAETGVAGTMMAQFSVGVPGNTGAVALLPNTNNRGWVPGVTIKNNLVTHSGRTGIQIGGDPNAPQSYAQRIGAVGPLVGLFAGGREVVMFLPFVRVLNNTVYNARVGIAASNTSSPTIINNVIANITEVPQIERFAGAGAAIYVDFGSGAPRTDIAIEYQKYYGSSVVSANVFQGNRTNGNAGSLAISLAPTEPLFVDAANNNFYLDKNSKAIDSSIDSLLDRAELFNVVSALGFPPSPVLAPAIDLLGQQRVDDPSVAPPAGVGGNAFKDRGALERADFLGPTAQLLNPVDNDASGNDRNTAANEVTLLNVLLTDFSIQLLDSGVGIDPATVTADKFVVTRTVNGSTTTLVPGVDFAMAYDTNSRIARLVPSQGVWINGIYTIRLVNSGERPISDLAGNALQANAPPETRFIVNLTDTIASPWQNPNNPADVNYDGRVNGSDLLLLINRILVEGPGPLPVVATAPPYLDPTGDGRVNSADMLAVINYILNPPASAAPLTVGADASPAEGEGEVSPFAVPLTANGSNAIVVGLAAKDQGNSSADEPVAVPAAASTSETPSHLHSRSVDQVMYGEVPQIAGVDELEAWDADLEGILSDLDSGTLL